MTELHVEAAADYIETLSRNMKYKDKIVFKSDDEAITLNKLRDIIDHKWLRDNVSISSIFALKLLYYR